MLSAFDQNTYANETFSQNFAMEPCSRNLDSISLQHIPPADIWWLSPPCTPFSRRGHQLGLLDNRAKAFLNLLSILEQAPPEILFLENVCGFADSTGEEQLLRTLERNQFKTRRIFLCPSQFGIPMVRPRVFYVATRTDHFEAEYISPETDIHIERKALCSYLDKEFDPALTLDDNVRDKYQRGMDIIDPEEPDARAICFTSGYARSMRAAGSFLRLPDGKVRRFSPEEIVRLLGFSEKFAFPETVPLANRFRLAGNSVEVTCLRYLLAPLVRT